MVEWQKEFDVTACKVKGCKEKIGLTDVRGHYSGVCKKCRGYDEESGLDLPDKPTTKDSLMWRDIE